MRLSVRTGSLVALVSVFVGCHDSPVASNVSRVTPPYPEPAPVPPALFRVISIQPHVSDYPTWMGVQLLPRDSGYQVMGVDFDVDWHRFGTGQCDVGCRQGTAWQLGVPDSTHECCSNNLGAVVTASGIVAVTEGWDSGVDFRVCATGCGLPGGWTKTTLFASGNLGDVYGHSHPLAIDGGGTLHLLYHAERSGGLQYARCSAGCSDSSAWQRVKLVDTTPGHVSDVRDFAIVTDSAGAVAVIVTTFSGAVRYLACASACVTLANWSTTTIDSNRVSQSPALVRGSDGALRLVYEATPGGVNNCAWNCSTRFGVCASNCTTPAGWNLVTLVSTGAADASVALDHQLNPWIAISGQVGTNAGARNAIAVFGSVLLLHCDSVCGTTSSWHQAPIDSLGGAGWISLAMDTRNQPHIAVSGFGVDYAELKDSTTALVSRYRAKR